MKPTKLPIGIQTFSQIRSDGYIYVDKTAYLLRLIDTGKVYFLSRPRRFGKSLTVSTFEALFSGKKELFDGTIGGSRLAAAEWFDRSDYRNYPVVHIDMSQAIASKTLEELELSMFIQVQRNAQRYGIVLSNLVAGNPTLSLSELFVSLHQQQGPVVVLVDEYDKPILDCISTGKAKQTEDEIQQTIKKADEVRRVLRSFYTQIKAEDAAIKFVFVTGISKFTQTGVFSTMNNLNDISVDDAYSQMLGLTTDELGAYFAPRLESISQKYGWTQERLLDEIAEYYDGFSFNGVERVYNPFSTLKFLEKSYFNNYWFDSGQTLFMTNYLQKHKLAMEDFRGREVDSFFMGVHEIEQSKPESFLCQSGYLTIRERLFDENFGITYRLDYPNKEVFQTISRLFIDLANLGNDSLQINRDLIGAFDRNDLDEVVSVINRVLASIPCNLYIAVEKYYHTLLYCLMVGAGINARAEDRSKAGSADIVVERRDKTTGRSRYWVIEVKTSPDAAHAEAAAKKAMKQIHDRGYYKKFPPQNTTLLGLAVDLENKLAVRSVELVVSSEELGFGG